MMADRQTDADHARAAASYLETMAISLDRKGLWTAHDSAMAVHHFCACLGLDVPPEYAEDVADELTSAEAHRDAEFALFDRSRLMDARRAA